MLRRFVCLLSVAALTVIGLPPAGADPWKGSCSLEEHSNEAGSRAYLVCVPSKVHHDAPVVVYLHGCTQTAEDARFGTRWDALGEEHGFITVFPEQPASENGTQCWNWFDGVNGNWGRDGEEPSLIAGLTNAVVDHYKADPERVYVAGASAGGSMAGIMAATYPDLYAAVGIVAAPAFAGDPTGTLAYRAMGDHARPVPTLIFQGTVDALVNYPTGRTALDQSVGMNDYADDDERNGSVGPSGQDAIVLPSSAIAPQPTADPCVAPPRSFPCLGPLLGLQDHYPHTIERFGADETAVEFWTIHGLGHAYPGGYPGEPEQQESNTGTFTDPTGPSFTHVAFDFFMSHPMPTEES